jgi:hypothetical protein
MIKMTGFKNKTFCYLDAKTISIPYKKTAIILQFLSFFQGCAIAKTS